MADFRKGLELDPENKVMHTQHTVCVSMSARAHCVCVCVHVCQCVCVCVSVLTSVAASVVRDCLPLNPKPYPLNPKPLNPKP
jgi:hypothetical protein